MPLFEPPPQLVYTDFLTNFDEMKQNGRLSELATAAGGADFGPQKTACCWGNGRPSKNVWSRRPPSQGTERPATPKTAADRARSPPFQGTERPGERPVIGAVSSRADAKCGRGGEGWDCPWRSLRRGPQPRRFVYSRQKAGSGCDAVRGGCPHPPMIYTGREAGPINTSEMRQRYVRDASGGYMERCVGMEEMGRR